MRLSKWLISWMFASAVKAQHEAQTPLMGVDEASEADDCHNACSALHQVLGDHKAFYQPLSHLAYPEDFFTDYYFSQQRAIIPSCVIRPSNAQDISVAVQIITKYSCPFAIKSGGGGGWAGSSNVEGGIVIDLKNLDGLEVVREVKGDGKEGITARVGPGKKWLEVYSLLEKEGLTVVGGRNGDIGVGGLVLGGGISYVSRQRGWAADNVRNYEIVLPNGTIAQISRTTDRDLYRALRGAGNHFGIVTRFDLEAYPQGLFSGGIFYYILSDVSSRKASLGIPANLSYSWLQMIVGALAPSLIRAACYFGYCILVADFIHALMIFATGPKPTESAQEDVDPHLQAIASWGYSPELDTVVGCSVLTNSRPADNKLMHPGFGHLKSVYNTQRMANLTEHIVELTALQVAGQRQQWRTMTIKADHGLISKLFDIFLFEVHTLRNVSGVVPSSNLQPISHMAAVGVNKNGGNMFDFSEEDTNLLQYSITTSYNNSGDDALVLKFMHSLCSRSEALAEEMGLKHKWIYPNYANESQDVYSGFGEENREWLRKMRDQYDPESLWRERLKGSYLL